MNYRFARDGHLLDLDVDAWITGDLGFSQRDDVKAHVDGCLLCRRRVEEAKELYAAPAPPLRAAEPPAPIAGSAPPGTATPFALNMSWTAPPGTSVPLKPTAPTASGKSASAAASTTATAPPPVATPGAPPPATALPPVAPIVPRASPSAIANAAAAAVAQVGTRPAGSAAPTPAKRWAVPAAATVGALVLLKLIWPTGEANPTLAPPDGVRLEVHREIASGKKEPLLDGATARAGDQIGFRVRLARPAYALVLSVPPSGEPFAIWPAGAEATAPLPLSSGAQEIATTVELPVGTGQSRLIAVACTTPHTVGELLADAASILTEPVPLLESDCDQSVVNLRQIAAAN